MTTTVIIKSPKPNHLDVLVQVLGPRDPNGVCAVRSETRLCEGDEVTHYVYGDQHISVTEVERLPAE